MSALTEAIEKAQRIAISGHVRPDGDCVGSCLTVYNYIRKNYPDKEVKVYLENFPVKFLFLKGSENIIHKLKGDEQPFDLFVCCDASAGERLGEFAEILKTAAHTICVDHHVTNAGIAEINVIDPDASSTSELMFSLLDPEKIDSDSATCMYHGIVHDTGVFRYSCTTRKTMRIASSLMKYGLTDRDKCIDSFFSKTVAGVHIWGCIMERAKTEFGGKCIYSYATWKDLKKYRAESMDMEGVVSEIINAENAVCSAFLYQTGEKTFKVSLRSKGSFDVASIAAGFGGGGHSNASGCELSGELENCIETILAEIGKNLEEHPEQA